MGARDRCTLGKDMGSEVFTIHYRSLWELAPFISIQINV